MSVHPYNLLCTLTLAKLHLRNNSSALFLPSYKSYFLCKCVTDNFQEGVLSIFYCVTLKIVVTKIQFVLTVVQNIHSIIYTFFCFIQLKLMNLTIVFFLSV